MSDSVITSPSLATLSGPPSTRGVLSVLTKTRLTHLARGFGIPLQLRWSKDEQVEALLADGNLAFQSLLDWMSRDELKAACRLHGLEESGRARAILVGRLLEESAGAELWRHVWHL